MLPLTALLKWLAIWVDTSSVRGARYQPYADGENYKYATITIGVPVEQFERALSRLRGLAVKVLDETASGEDVTNQFVDLQSTLD